MAIADVSGSIAQPGAVTRLRVDLKDDSSAFLAELYDLATRQFPGGSWNNFGPDSSYREIVFFCQRRKVVLRSWHPLAEQDPRVVAASYGLTSLDGKDRESFLRVDDPGYVEKRRAYDRIEERLRRQYGG